MDKRVLDRMLEILGPNGEHWTQGREARNHQGEMTTWDSPDAVCFCIYGAERKALSEFPDINRTIFLMNFLRYHRRYQDGGLPIFQWNDAQGRTWEEIRNFLFWMKDELSKDNSTASA